MLENENEMIARLKSLNVNTKHATCMSCRHLEDELDDKNVTVLMCPFLVPEHLQRSEAINHASVVVLTL